MTQPPTTAQCILGPSRPGTTMWVEEETLEMTGSLGTTDPDRRDPHGPSEPEESKIEEGSYDGPHPTLGN